MTGDRRPSSSDIIHSNPEAFTNGDGKWKRELYNKKHTVKKKRENLAAKHRRRGRQARREAEKDTPSDHKQARRQELLIATHTVRTIAVDGKHGVGRAAEVLGV